MYKKIHVVYWFGFFPLSLTTKIIQEVSLVPIVGLNLLEVYNATVLLSMVSYLRLLFRFISCFPVGSLIFKPISLLHTPKSLATCVPCVVPRAVREWGGGVGTHGWRVGVLGLICVFNQAGGLTCQLNSRFRIPVQLPFPQGTGYSSSVDHW